MATSNPYLAISLQFHYTHGFGARAPFFDALKDQRALGSQCSQCGRCWYPPRHTCPHDHTTTAWCDLVPRGSLLQVTNGPGSIPLASDSGDLLWALIQVDGCSNAMLARVTGPPDGVYTNVRVVLVGHDNAPAHPIQYAVFAPVTE